MDIALEEHAEAKAVIARIEGMKATGAASDATATGERVPISLKARNAGLDLRAMLLPLLKLQQHLKKKSAVATATATPTPTPTPTPTAKETA